MAGNRNLKPRGRPKGSPNRVQADVKAMILEALDLAGGVEYLCHLAVEHPTVFAQLVGRVLPLQVTADVNQVSYVIRAPSPIESAADWLAVHAPSDQREPLTIEHGSPDNGVVSTSVSDEAAE